MALAVLILDETFTFSRGIEPIVVGASVSVYLLLYMGLWFWLRKRGILKFVKDG